MSDPKDLFFENRQISLGGEHKAALLVVDAPLSFGHTQLSLSFEKCDYEDERFLKSAEFIKRVIRINQKHLEDWTGELSEFADSFLHSGSASEIDGSELAKPVAVGSLGKYDKTCVVRASADEKSGQYKVHLVPVYEAHLKANKAWFRKKLCRLGTTDEVHGDRGLLISQLGQLEIDAQRKVISRKADIADVYFRKVNKEALENLASLYKHALYASA